MIVTIWGLDQQQALSLEELQDQHSDEFILDVTECAFDSNEFIKFCFDSAEIALKVLELFLVWKGLQQQMKKEQANKDHNEDNAAKTEAKEIKIKIKKPDKKEISIDLEQATNDALAFALDIVRENR